MIQIVLNNPLTMCGYDGAYKTYFGRTRKNLDMSKASDITFSELCQNSICLEIVNLLTTNNTNLAKELIKTIEFVYMNHNNVQQTLNYQTYINSPTVKRMSLNPENDNRPLWGLSAEKISYEWFCRDFVTLMRLDYHLENIKDTPDKYSIFDVTYVRDLYTLVGEWIRKHVTSMITLDMPITEWKHPFDYIVDVWTSVTELIIHSNGVPIINHKPIYTDNHTQNTKIRLSLREKLKAIPVYLESFEIISFKAKGELVTSRELDINKITGEEELKCIYSDTIIFDLLKYSNGQNILES